MDKATNKIVKDFDIPTEIGKLILEEVDIQLRPDNLPRVVCTYMVTETRQSEPIEDMYLGEGVYTFRRTNLNAIRFIESFLSNNNMEFQTNRDMGDFDNSYVIKAKHTSSNEFKTLVKLDMDIT